jgi:hypothetical protein
MSYKQSGTQFYRRDFLKTVLPVTVVGMAADGTSEDKILNALPDLKRQDIREALSYAAEMVLDGGLPLVGGR